MNNDLSEQYVELERSRVLISPYGGKLVQAFSAGPEGQALLR